MNWTMDWTRDDHYRLGHSNMISCFRLQTLNEDMQAGGSFFIIHYLSFHNGTS